MHRLYIRIYLTVLASILLFVVLVAIGWRTIGPGSEGLDQGRSELSRVAQQLTAELLPVELSEAQINEKLQRWQRQFDVNLTVFDASGLVIASAGKLVEAPQASELSRARGDDIWFRGRMLITLPGDRLLAGTDAGERRYFSGGKGPSSVLAFLLLAGLAVAIAAWPLTRRLTRRLESLQHSVQAFGSGDFASRSSIRGKDEIARLATSFNGSAQRIEQLITAQKSLLANASHELRSPLARIRMAVELIAGGAARDTHSAQAELLRNVGELDDLVDEILLASRLDADSDTSGAAHSRWSELDLGGILAEEAARVGASTGAPGLILVGDEKLLRRLVRNLLENARRYGAGGGSDAGDIETHLSRNGDQIELLVCDRGPGIPEAERERIFEPFYRVPGASERAGGVGLGLSLVRQIAGHHGGRVQCEARPGGGTCFRVRLPAPT